MPCANRCFDLPVLKFEKLVGECLPDSFGAVKIKNYLQLKSINTKWQSFRLITRHQRFITLLRSVYGDHCTVIRFQVNSPLG